MSGESWPPSCFFDPHDGLPLVFLAGHPHLLLPSSSLPLMFCRLSDFALVNARVCSDGCSPRCIWHLPLLLKNSQACFLFQVPLTLAAFFSSSLWNSRNSSCDCGVVCLDVPPLFSCLLSRGPVPESFMGTSLRSHTLSLATTCLFRWPPQAHLSLGFYFLPPPLVFPVSISPWASLASFFIPSSSISALSIWSITHLHPCLINLPLCHIRVWFECELRLFCLLCHLACLNYFMLKTVNNVSSFGNWSTQGFFCLSTEAGLCILKLT